MVNFLDMDLQQDESGTCRKDYVKLIDNTPSTFGPIGGRRFLIKSFLFSNSNFIVETIFKGSSGLKFCGQHLPNHPAPSVFVSGSTE